MKKEILPQRVVDSKEVLYKNNIFLDKPMQVPILLGIDYDESKSFVRIKKDGYILLDFGKEISGGVRISIQDVSNKCGRIRIKFGESAMEAMTEIGINNLNNYHSIIDYTIPALALSSQRIGDTGFRFVKIEALNTDIILRAVKAVFEITDAKELGRFECNDDVINDIWKTAVYTVKLNMNDYLTEGLKRDRLVWIGDIHPEVSTVRTAFGKNACVERSLDFVRDNTPLDKWMNNTGTYSMWWIIVHYDWYMHWGDLNYLKQQIEYLKRVCELAFEWIESGLGDKEDKMVNFVDWSSKGTDSEFEGRKSIFCMGMDAASKLFGILNEEKFKRKCRKYCDMLQSEKILKEYNKRVSALTILSGRDSVIAKKVIDGNSAKNMSTFLGYYVLKAKALCGDFKDSLDIIRNYWGAMLNRGATTFWEDFDIEWMNDSGRIDELTPVGLKDIHGDFGRYCYKGFRHSLCHGWASGPAPYLIEQIGGIEILEPGCKKLKISPNLGDLKWIKIAYPTPYGSLRIESSVSGSEQVKTKIDSPKEIEIIQ